MTWAAPESYFSRTAESFGSKNWETDDRSKWLQIKVCVFWQFHVGVLIRALEVIKREKQQHKWTFFFFLHMEEIWETFVRVATLLPALTH